jgi:hypothetical protein
MRFDYQAATEGTADSDQASRPESLSTIAETGDGSIELKASPMYALFVWLAAAGFFAAGVGLMLVSPGDDLVGRGRLLRHDAFRMGLGSVTMLMGGAMLVSLIYRFVRRRPLGLRLDSRGVTDQFHGLPFGLVPWSEISAIEATRGVTVSVDDPPSAFPSLPGWLARMHRGVRIPSLATRLAPSELAELLESWRAFYVSGDEDERVPGPDDGLERDAPSVCAVGHSTSGLSSRGWLQEVDGA